MDRILESYRFGPHRVDVLQHADDDGTGYVVLVDGAIVTDPPLGAAPRLEDVVRIYSTAVG